MKSKAEVENEFKAAKEDKNKLVKKISKYDADFKNARPCDEKSKVYYVCCRLIKIFANFKRFAI